LVAGLLVNRALDEALAGTPYRCRWSSFVMGLRLWLLREHSQLPSLAAYNADNILRSRLAQNSLPRLAWLGPEQTACSSSGSMQTRAALYPVEGAVSAFMDYAIHAYGPARLPALIDGMQRYASWATLIPAVYGVSAADFEAGWQKYLLKNEG
jgi:hypothetical protein